MLLLVVAVATSVQRPPPLAFVGFRAGMAVSDARAQISRSGGSLACKGTSDPRLRECTGSMPFPRLRRPFTILISSVRDSAGVIVLTSNIREGDTRGWVRALTEDQGKPNHKVEPGIGETWEWIRRGQMLRLSVRKVANQLETAVTLTHGPLLDALGPPPNKKPG